MSKIMVVEDDTNLREIYSIRITAEGYDVVSAGDGEEALALAVREKPDLILSDVMMPKISGFDMLDILRSTPEIANIKVVIMTALSSDDQRQRGEHLGADRYLVKSQVGIEDVINAIHEVLGDKEPQPAKETPANSNPPQANNEQPSAQAQ
ncbi:response regulator [Candidatus Saccharibacteria bacterium]|nr:response regulator [Candidatus Saccharibacteria bacterium]